MSFDDLDCVHMTSNSDDNSHEFTLVKIENKNVETYKEYFDRAGIYDSLKNIFEIESTPFLAFYENDKYGFIDTSGNTAIKPKLLTNKKIVSSSLVRKLLQKVKF